MAKIVVRDVGAETENAVKAAKKEFNDTLKSVSKKFTHPIEIAKCPKCGTFMTREIRWTDSGTSIWADVCLNPKCAFIKATDNPDFGWLV